MNGYIRLHRKILENSIFFSDKGLRVWLWCLLKSGNKEKEIYIGRQKIKLLPGQFIYGRLVAAEELKLSASTVRNWMHVLQQDKYLDIKTTNKYSIITILKWSDYQYTGQQSGQQSGQQMDTNNNILNNINNIYNNIIYTSEKILSCSLPVNKSNIGACKRLLKKFKTEDKIYQLAKIAKSFDNTEYPYVIKSLSALYDKSEKILARHEQRQLIEKNKKKEMTYEGNKVIRKFNKLFVEKNGQLYEFSGNKNQIKNYYE